MSFSAVSMSDSGSGQRILNFFYPREINYRILYHLGDYVKAIARVYFSLVYRV